VTGDINLRNEPPGTSNGLPIFTVGFLDQSGETVLFQIAVTEQILFAD
jgi:hypothetical protein